MLLEEIILFLLEHSGYSCIKLKQDSSGEEHDDSNMITRGHSGMELRGRGAKHQIDAIVDFDFTIPFSYPIRLLVEAKCYNAKVGIDVIRNAFGVLSDVNEGWTLDEYKKLYKKRYHYQYAVASTSGFSSEAINYAYVHDIFLFDLSSSVAFKPIRDILDNLKASDFPTERLADKDFQKQLRKSFHNCLFNGWDPQSIIQVLGREEIISYMKIDEIYGSCRTIKERSYLGVIGKTYPVLLFVTDENREYENNVNNDESVQIYWQNNIWYIKRGDRCLYAFSLPKQLLDLYAENGFLSSSSALNLKETEMDTIQVFMKNPDNNTIKCDYLRLDKNWLEAMKKRLNHN